MLSSFSLTSWRGINTVMIDLAKKTYIRGINGSGKTHILDAIHLLSGSRPLYGNTSLETGTIFETMWHDTDLSKSYRMFHDGTREFFAIQGTKVTKPKYLQSLPWRTVHISPFDMNLLYFAPQMRRDYMDLILSRTYEQFPRIERDYQMTMRQRNAMLKKIREGAGKREDLDFWDSKFAELAELYGLYRERYVNYIRTHMTHFPIFFARYPIEFIYEEGGREKGESEKGKTGDGETNKAEMIIEYLRVNRERDILTGHTHIGPHRDDWGFRVGKCLDDRISQKQEVPRLSANEVVDKIVCKARGRKIFSKGAYESVSDGEINFSDDEIRRFSEISTPAESYLSRGEMKMLLIGLKMIERSFIAETLSLSVILLIDDIFAELDDDNSQAFLDSLMQYQVILTSQKPLPNHEKYHDFTCINLGDD